MNYPKLKNPILCRILVYIVVIGAFFIPSILVAVLPFISDAVKVVVFMVSCIGFIYYVIKNIAVLMAVDVTLAQLNCYNKARKRFILPKTFSVEAANRRISKFGKQYEPTAISPKPEMLRYKSKASAMVYSRGIERVIATYSINFLDKTAYRSIVNSAKVNSDALKGRKKRHTDKSNKNAPWNRATVVLIYAKSVDEKFAVELHKTVCKNGGDGFDTAFLPCVIDSEKGICTFDSMRIPFIGFGYPAKSRGINLIRKYLFGGSFPLADSPDFLEPMKDIDVEQTLWRFMKDTKKEMILDDKESKKRFEKMKHGEIIFEDGYIYLKWSERAIWTAVELDEENKTAQIDPIDYWYYPKANKIAKATTEEIKALINSYFTELGYATRYIT